MLRRIFLIGGAGIGGALSLALVQIKAGALFGVSGELDAFFVGAALPSVLLAIGAASIGVLMVPRLPTGDPGVTATAAGRMAARGFLVGVAATALVELLAPLVIDLLGPGFDATTAEQATRVLRIYALSIPATVAALVYGSYGYASGRVWASGISTAIYGFTWLGLLFIPAFADNVESATTAGLLATGVQLATAFGLASKPGVRPWPAFTGLGLARPGMVALVTVVGTAIIARIGLLLDPLFGSLLDEGSVSQLAYAARIAGLAVFASGQGAAFGLMIAGREGEQSDSEARVGLVAPLLLSISAAAILVGAGPPLAELILARGELSTADAIQIGELLRLWAPAIVGMTMVWALEALLYAELRTGAVLRRAGVGLAVNALISIPFVIVIGLEGRPLAVVVAVVIQLALLVALLRDDPRVAPIFERRTAGTVGLHAAIAVAVLMSSLLVVGQFADEQAAAVAATVAVGIASLAFLRAYGGAEERRR